jgi:hypothetical protein
MTTQRLRSQDGWAVVTAVVLMSIMLTIALAAIAFVDTETRSSGRERTHEARLNLAEGVMAAELYRLSGNWPDADGKVIDCDQTSTDARCPQLPQVKAQFSGVDFKLDPKWTIKVRDDDAPQAVGSRCSVTPPPGFYSSTRILAEPLWDANGNCQMWVQVEGSLGGVRRTIVAKVRVENRAPVFPQGPFVAGSFNTSNNGGSKTIIDGRGVQGTVRCSTGVSCADFKGQQVTNPGSVSKGDPNIGTTALDPAMLDALRKIAQANHTYYTSCPSGTNPNGDVVFVESGNCSFTAGTPTINGAVNGGTKKGIFVVNNGTISISGNLVWYGAIYMANAQGCGPTSFTGCLNGKYKDTVADISGTATLYGGIYVDGNGRLQAGSSGNAGANNLPNLVYDPTTLSDVTAYGTAGIIQNTWRELTSG